MKLRNIRRVRRLIDRGKYDEEYIDYVIQVLQKCQEHGLLVFMDPHQDVVCPLFAMSLSTVVSIFRWFRRAVVDFVSGRLQSGKLSRH
jgi:hypothetical protein